MKFIFLILILSLNTWAGHGMRHVIDGKKAKDVYEGLVNFLKAQKTDFVSFNDANNKWMPGMKAGNCEKREDSYRCEYSKVNPVKVEAIIGRYTHELKARTSLGAILWDELNKDNAYSMAWFQYEGHEYLVMEKNTPGKKDSMRVIDARFFEAHKLRDHSFYSTLGTDGIECKLGQTVVFGIVARKKVTENQEFVPDQAMAFDIKKEKIGDLDPASVKCRMEVLI